MSYLRILRSITQLIRSQDAEQSVTVRYSFEYLETGHTVKNPTQYRYQSPRTVKLLTYHLLIFSETKNIRRTFIFAFVYVRG
jgi:hypothetical protein